MTLKNQSNFKKEKKIYNWIVKTIPIPPFLRWVVFEQLWLTFIKPYLKVIEARKDGKKAEKNEKKILEKAKGANSVDEFVDKLSSD